jgi:tRNA uridine 5-carbamoylmethylation protein Kti12
MYYGQNDYSAVDKKWLIITKYNYYQSFRRCFYKTQIL